MSFGGNGVAIKDSFVVVAEPFAAKTQVTYGCFVPYGSGIGDPSKVGRKYTPIVHWSQAQFQQISMISRVHSGKIFDSESIRLGTGNLL